MSPVLDAPSVLPEVPDGWVPDDELILVIGKRLPADGGWEVVIPMFSIVGRGESIDEAMHEARELLEDYLRMCVDDGLTYAEAKRPIPDRWLVPLALATVRSMVGHRLRHSARRLRIMRIPARHALC